MNNYSGLRGLHLVLGGALMVAAGIAQAQYVWVNEKGVRQISDKAPPASVPVKNILRAPGGVPLEAPPAKAQPGADPQFPAAGSVVGPALDKDGKPKSAAELAADAARANMTPDQARLADREADYKKRKLEAAEKEAKDKAERLQKENRKASCDSAKQYKATLDSNQAVTTVGPNGEAVYMEEAQRKKLGDQAQRVLNECKKG
ncbi:MAG: DUF4124 domain-containing protein [Pseudomonadota bacterium]